MRRASISDVYWQQRWLAGLIFCGLLASTPFPLALNAQYPEVRHRLFSGMGPRRGNLLAYTFGPIRWVVAGRTKGQKNDAFPLSWHLSHCVAQRSNSVRITFPTWSASPFVLCSRAEMQTWVAAHIWKMGPGGMCLGGLVGLSAGAAYSLVTVPPSRVIGWPRPLDYSAPRASHIYPITTKGPPLHCIADWGAALIPLSRQANRDRQLLHWARLEQKEKKHG